MQKLSLQVQDPRLRQFMIELVDRQRKYVNSQCQATEWTNRITIYSRVDQSKYAKALNN